MAAKDQHVLRAGLRRNARFGISNAGAHRAGADMLMTAKLLQHMHQAEPITAELVNATSTAKSKAKAAATPTLFAA